MSTNLKCECGAYYEPTMCPVCQEERWIEEINSLRARIAELEAEQLGLEYDVDLKRAIIQSLDDDLREIYAIRGQDPEISRLCNHSFQTINS